jgi:hypothetical protein
LASFPLPGSTSLLHQIIPGAFQGIFDPLGRGVEDVDFPGLDPLNIGGMNLSGRCAHCPISLFQSQPSAFCSLMAVVTSTFNSPASMLCKLRIIPRKELDECLPLSLSNAIAGLTLVDSLHKIDKLRETRVLYGFSRLLAEKPRNALPYQQGLWKEGPSRRED